MNQATAHLRPKAPDASEIRLTTSARKLERSKLAHSPFCLRPHSAAYRLFVGPTAKGRSGSNGAV